MSKTYEQILAELNAKIPRDVVMEREGGGGKSFSYLAGHYVIGRMNEVFGQGQWNYLVEEVRCVHSGTIQDRYGKDVHTTHYIARGRLEVRGIGSIFTDVGYGDGSDKTNPGKAHELAVKEAATDAFKRCARNLGNSMGLALYDKDQEGVDDGEPAPRAAAKAAKPAKPQAVAQPPVEKRVPEASGAEEAKASSVSEIPPEDREQLNTIITKLAGVIGSQAGPNNKNAKIQELVKGMREKYKVSKKEELTDEQAREFYQTLRGMINE